MKNIKYLLLLVVFICNIPAYAGSYEDFFSALNRDDSQTVASLLQRGFDPNTPNPDGVHGLLLAVRAESWKSVDALLQSPTTEVDGRNASDETALMLVCLKGQLDLAGRLIERGADVNKVGWTPLHYAATNGHGDVIRLLLEHHAYIDAESPNGTTPLMMAASYGTPVAVKILLEAGADPLLKNQRGLTAIDFAERAQRREASELIAAFVRAAQPRGKW